MCLNKYIFQGFYPQLLYNCIVELLSAEHQYIFVESLSMADSTVDRLFNFACVAIKLLYS